MFRYVFPFFFFSYLFIIFFIIYFHCFCLFVCFSILLYLFSIFHYSIYYFLFLIINFYFINFFSFFQLIFYSFIIFFIILRTALNAMMMMMTAQMVHKNDKEVIFVTPQRSFRVKIQHAICRHWGTEGRGQSGRKEVKSEYSFSRFSFS